MPPACHVRLPRGPLTARPRVQNIDRILCQQDVSESRTLLLSTCTVDYSKLEMTTKTSPQADTSAFKPSAKSISILGRHFVDDKGRILALRGANVGSASKVYVPVERDGRRF